MNPKPIPSWYRLNTFCVSFATYLESLSSGLFKQLVFYFYCICRLGQSFLFCGKKTLLADHHDNAMLLGEYTWGGARGIWAFKSCWDKAVHLCSQYNAVRTIQNKLCSQELIFREKSRSCITSMQHDQWELEPRSEMGSKPAEQLSLHKLLNRH